MKQAKNKRTKKEMIDYFNELAFSFEKQAHRENDNPVFYAKAESYRLCAFELEHNME